MTLPPPRRPSGHLCRQGRPRPWAARRHQAGARPRRPLPADGCGLSHLLCGRNLPALGLLWPVGLVKREAPCGPAAAPGARRALPTALPGTEGSHHGQLARPCLRRWGEWGLASARPRAGSRHHARPGTHGAPRRSWPRPRLRRPLRTRGGCQHRVDGQEGLDLCCVPATHGAPRWCRARAPSPLCTCSLSRGVPAGHPAFASPPASARDRPPHGSLAARRGQRSRVGRGRFPLALERVGWGLGRTAHCVQGSLQ